MSPCERWTWSIWPPWRDEQYTPSAVCTMTSQCCDVSPNTFVINTGLPCNLINDKWPTSLQTIRDIATLLSGLILLPADRHFGGNYVGYSPLFLRLFFFSHQVYNFDWTVLSHKKKGYVRLYWSPRGWVSNLLFTSLWKKNSLAISVYCCRHVRWRMAKTPPDEVGDIVRTIAGRGGGLLPWRQMYSEIHEEWR